MIRKWLDLPRHIETINDELGEVVQRIATLEADMRWVKRLTIIGVGSAVTTLGGVALLVIKIVFVGI